MFSDKSGVPQVDNIRNKMKHALNAGDILCLQEIVKVAEKINDDDGPAKGQLEKEVNFCIQRIDAILEEDETIRASVILCTLIL